MNKDMTIQRCNYYQGVKQPKAVFDILDPMCASRDFTPHVDKLLTKGYKLDGVEKILPSFNIVVSSAKHGMHAWQLHAIHPQMSPENFKDYLIHLRNIKLGHISMQSMGFDRDHTTRYNDPGEDQRNLVWFDTTNLVFFSYNRSALVVLNKLLDNKLKQKLIA